MKVQERPAWGWVFSSFLARARDAMAPLLAATPFTVSNLSVRLQWILEIVLVGLVSNNSSALQTNWARPSLSKNHSKSPTKLPKRDSSDKDSPWAPWSLFFNLSAMCPLIWFSSNKRREPVTFSESSSLSRLLWSLDEHLHHTTTRKKNIAMTVSMSFQTLYLLWNPGQDLQEWVQQRQKIKLYKKAALARPKLTTPTKTSSDWKKRIGYQQRDLPMRKRQVTKLQKVANQMAQSWLWCDWKEAISDILKCHHSLQLLLLLSLLS